MSTSKRPPRSPGVLFGTFGLVVGVFGLSVALCGRATTPAAHASSLTPPTEPPPAAAAAPTFTPTPLTDEQSRLLKIALIRQAPTMTDALSRARPEMSDVFGNVDRGTLLFTSWAVTEMHWSDVAVAKDETSVALVKKDPDESRGKRLCASGSIIQIDVAKTQFGRTYSGLLQTYSGNLVQYTAVGSSGSLVEQSDARICGVVTGVYDYPNSGGGTGHAIKVVGMFDLPENKPKGAQKKSPPEGSGPYSGRTVPDFTPLPGSDIVGEHGVVGHH